MLKKSDSKKPFFSDAKKKFQIESSSATKSIAELKETPDNVKPTTGRSGQATGMKAESRRHQLNNKNINEEPCTVVDERNEDDYDEDEVAEETRPL